MCFFLFPPAKYKVEQVVEPTTQRGVIFPSVKNYPTEGTGLGLQIEVRDPNEAILLSKTYGKEGRIAVTSHMAGDHTICLSSNDTSLDGSMKVHLDIKIGGRAIDYDLVSKKEKLTSLQLQLRKIQDLIQQIQKEQDYQRTRETRFRSTSESTNWRVLFFAFVQTVILIAVGVYQVKHLKFFFILKKLV